MQCCARRQGSDQVHLTKTDKLQGESGMKRITMIVAAAVALAAHERRGRRAAEEPQGAARSAPGIS